MDQDETKPTHSTGSGGRDPRNGRNHRLRMFGRTVPLPASQILRMALGIILLAGGLLWFLPILGIWMLPLGLAVLSVDVPIVRRWSRRASVALHRRYPQTMSRIFPSHRNRSPGSSSDS